MIAPIVRRLLDDGGRVEVSELLWHELADHFGVDPAERDVDAMPNRLVAWWIQVPPALNWS